MANQSVQGTLLPSTAALAHTVSASMVADVVRLTLQNNHSSPVDYTIWFLDSADSGVSNNRKVIDTGAGGSLAPGEVTTLVFQPHLQEGDEIFWEASVASQLAGFLDIREVTKAGHERIDCDWLSASLATKYTVNASKEMTIFEYSICNTDTVDRLVEVQVIPSGQSAAARRRILNQQAGSLALKPGQTQKFRFNPKYLGAGGFIQAKADVANVVTFQGAVFEEDV